MIKAVIYARYSNSSQTEQSIEGQVRVCREFAERNGYVIVSESQIELKQEQMIIVLQSQEENNSILKVLLKEHKQVENTLNNIMKAIEQGIINNTINKRMKDLENELAELDR